MVTIFKRDKAKIDKLINEIKVETDSEKNAVFASTLQVLVNFQELELEFKTLIAEGLKNKSPEILLAAVQHLEDNHKELFRIDAKNVRSLSKTTSMLNNMTKGEFYVEATCRSIIGDMSLKNAAEERLRNTAQRILHEKNDKKQEIQIKPPEIEEVSLAPKM